MYKRQGIDNLNDYYDVSLKEYRLKELENWDNFSFHKGNIAYRSFLEQIFQKWEPEIVVNLAAQAGAVSYTHLFNKRIRRFPIEPRPMTAIVSI